MPRIAARLRRLTTLSDAEISAIMQRVGTAFERKARANAEEHGKLAATIRYEQLGPRRGRLLAAGVTRYVEYATRPHIIRPRYKRALHWQGAKHPVGVVHHPGYRGDPFILEAWHSPEVTAEKRAALQHIFRLKH